MYYHGEYRSRKGRNTHVVGVFCFLLTVVLLAGLIAQARTAKKDGFWQPAEAPQSAQQQPQQEQKVWTAAEFQWDVPVNAECAVLYDVGNNEILLEKNWAMRCEPASLTKLLTVLTAYENDGESIRYTVGDEIEQIGENSSVAYLRQGDALSFEAIVDAVLLSSGNDATYALAVNVARHQSGQNLSVADALAYFSTLMNETAQRIGCTDSHFASVDGYPDAAHYSTAQDLLRIAVAASRNPVMADSMAKSRAYHMFYSGRDVVWETTNKLLQSESDYAYPYATGMKTGSTSASNYSLAASAEKDGRNLIAIVVAAESNDARFADAIALFDYGFQ